MEITKELKEKLLKANSEEEVKALLGDAVKEEDVTKIWKEIEAHKADPDLKKVDDDELDAVSGGKGWSDENAPDGHERSCYYVFHSANECPNSPDGLHYWCKKTYESQARCRYCSAASMIANINL